MQNTDVQAALAVHKDMLKAKHNVVDVGVGYKTTKGVMTDQPALVVFVRRKVAATTLTTTDLVPPMLGTVATDVVELGDVSALATDVTPKPAIHREKHRPVVGGISCGVYVSFGAGTIGLPLVFREGVPGLLSNKHVISPSWLTARDPSFVWKGARVRQPAALDGGTVDDSIAEAQDLVPIVLGQENDVDADFAPYLPGYPGEAQIYGLGAYNALGDAEPGLVVTKSGRTSGVSPPRQVISAGITLAIDYPGLGVVTFRDQIITQPMLSPGDSGSAILSGQTVVGLGFAGSDTVSIANPIKTVFERLGLTLQGPARPPASLPVPITQGLQSLLSQGILWVAWGFDARIQKFLLFDPAAPQVSDLALLEPGKGYWLNLKRNGLLSYQGKTTPLQQGWNLIGWPVA